MTDRSADIEAVARDAALTTLRWKGVAPLETVVELFHRDSLNNHAGHLSRHMAQRYLDAYLAARAAIEALRPIHAAAEAKVRLEAYEDAAGVARAAAESLIPNMNPEYVLERVAAAILQRGGEKG